jgi:hypothetical protein
VWDRYLPSASIGEPAVRSQAECRAPARFTMRTPQKDVLAVVGFPKGSARELLAAVHDDALAQRRRRLFVLDDRIRVGCD